MAIPTITPKGTGELSVLDNVFAKVSHVYWLSSPINSAPSGTVSADLELPIIEGSVSFDTGGIDKTEVKLTTGKVWTSKATKSDSAITIQIASLNSSIASLFLTSKGDGAYDLDVKKSVGALLFLDETGKGLVVLPKVEMYGSLVVGEGDNPAYFNATVTPLSNNAGVSIYINTEEADA